jgi:hypothetical protein
MNIKQILSFLSLSLLLVSFNVYAVDQRICHSGKDVVLYDNGSLKSCQLEDDYEANSIRCKSLNTVSFYDNGHLESCVMSESATIGANKCKQDGPISFYPDGKLKSCIKPE